MCMYLGNKVTFYPPIVVSQKLIWKASFRPMFAPKENFTIPSS